MVKRNFISLFLFLSTCAVHAQDQNAIDSLKSVIKQARHDTSVCKAYLSWGEQVYLRNPDTALVLWHAVKDIASKNLPEGYGNDASWMPSSLEKKYLATLSSALNNIGYIYDDYGEAQIGLKYYNKSLKIKEVLGDKKGVAASLNNIAVVYLNQGDIEKALELFFESLHTYELMEDKMGVSYALNNIGNIYINQGETEKALESFIKSLKIREEIGDQKGEATSLNNIGGIYDKDGNYKKALAYFSRGLKVREELGDIRGAANSLTNIGGIHRTQEHYQEALRYLYRSKEAFEKVGDKKGETLALINIGSCYVKDSKLDSAEKVTLQAFDLSYKLGYPALIKSSALVLNQLYRKQNLWEQALEKYELYIQMRDSITNERTQKATIRQQTKYEFEKAQLVEDQKEKEKARLEAELTTRRDNLQYSVILIAILMLFGGVLSLGFVKVSERIAEGIIFFSFLILFEFLLVLADPYIEGWSGGAPGIKLLFNAGIAALIFPAHAFFESRLKGKLVKRSA